jgi:hypothetical protein
VLHNYTRDSYYNFKMLLALLTIQPWRFLLDCSESLYSSLFFIFLYINIYLPPAVFLQKKRQFKLDHTDNPCRIFISVIFLIIRPIVLEIVITTSKFCSSCGLWSTIQVCSQCWRVTLAHLAQTQRMKMS